MTPAHPAHARSLSGYHVAFCPRQPDGSRRFRGLMDITIGHPLTSVPQLLRFTRIHSLYLVCRVILLFNCANLSIPNTQGTLHCPGLL